MSQSLSRRSFLKYAGSGAVSLAAALLTGVSGAALAPCYEGEPALLDGKAAVELLGYAPAPELDSTLVYLSVENLSARPLAVGASYLQRPRPGQQECPVQLGHWPDCPVRWQTGAGGSFAAPLYGENAADASAFTLNLSAGRGAMLHCFCETPADWQTLELIYQPDFAAGQTVHFVVRRDADEVHLGVVPATLAEVGSVVDL